MASATPVTAAGMTTGQGVSGTTGAPFARLVERLDRNNDGEISSDEWRRR